MQQSGNSPAFTLIELLTVVAIIGFFASLLVVNLSNRREVAKITKALEFGAQLRRVAGVDSVGIWDFEEGSGTEARDGSGYGNNGLILGATYDCSDTPYHVIGYEAGRCALSFDGSDYVNLGNDLSLTELTEILTVEAWAKANTGGSSGVVVSRATHPNGRQWRLEMDNGRFRFLAQDNKSAQWADADSPASAGRWYHLVGVLGNGVLTLYVNGVPQRNAGILTGNKKVNTEDIPVNIGRRHQPADLYWNGLIDDVRIYARALTLGEIQKLYAEGLSRHKLAEK